jgi:hypothetical protein
MSYQIKQYTKDKAKKFGVNIKQSTRKGKKIDVFDKEGNKIATIGALGYGDYPTFMQEKGKAFADKKRKNYKARHQKDRLNKNTNGWFADNLLW